MSTVKAVNLQHPSSANVNIAMDNSGNMTVNGSVKALTTANTIIALDNNAGSPRLHFYDGTNSPSNILGYIQSDGLVFNGAAGSERMRIDSSGRLTTQQQPYCLYSQLSSATQSSGGVNPIWQTRKLYRGTDGYSTSTGYYTAPVSGVYDFKWAYLYQGRSNGFNVDDGYIINGVFYFCGNRYSYPTYSFSDGYIAVQGFATAYLNANDTFAPRTANSGGSGWSFYSGDYWGFFSAALIN